MKESTRDRLAIIWAMFGALTFGTIFMTGMSIGITGEITKEIYNHILSGYDIVSGLIISMYIGLIIFGIWKGKLRWKK